jgi:type I restriction enzyme S subunit
MESGHTPSRRHPEYWSGHIPWISIGDARKAHGGTIFETEEHASSLGIENSSARVLPANTVCLSRTASIGYVVVTGALMATSQDFVNFVCSEQLWPRFLQFLFLAENQDLLRFASGSVHQTIYFPEAKAFHICIPSLTEQRRIVGVLDEAFKGIATAKTNAEQNLRNASALFESHLHHVYAKQGPGSVERRLDEVCAITSTLVDPRRVEYGNLIHVGAGNIESKTGSFVDLKTARQEGLISSKFLFDKSMVLYSKIRPYLMKVGRPDFSGLCSADMYPLAPNADVISRDYLFHLLLSKHFTDYVIQGSARAGMPKVNRQHLFDFRVWLPNLKEQERIAANLDQLHEAAQRLAKLYERKLGELDALKRSLLHQAFAGQL